VRNPDKWLPQGSDQPNAPQSRRGALVGMIVIVCLVVAGLALTQILGRMTRLQDCALSGRSNCGLQR
jgi:hypothetical protein